MRWLHLLGKLGLGACLADDMGLGKTIQALALLPVLKQRKGKPRKGAARAAVPPRSSLLVAPASLPPNWASELARLAPCPQAA